MKAAYIEATGGPDVIRYGDLPKPTPGEGEVLVRVGAVAVNPHRYLHPLRRGQHAAAEAFIIGCDLAGTVEAVGPGVQRFKAGDRVWGSNQGLLGRQGTFAEYASVHEEWLYPTPAGVADSELAAVGLTGITAHLGLFRCANTQPGEIVFVNGGTGGVGSMVVQMAQGRRREGHHDGRLAGEGGAVPQLGRRRRHQLQDRRRARAGAQDSPRTRASTSGTRRSASRTSSRWCR